MPIGSNILAGASGQATGYDIEQSLRFNDDDSAYLSRTPGSASNQKTWTWSGWVKRSNLGAYTNFFDAHTDNNNRFYLAFNASDKLEIYGTNSASNVLVLTTTAVYRDCSAFYHIAFQCDTTQASSSNRAKLYVNGEQVTAFDTATYPAQNIDLKVNSTAVHRISSYAGTSNYLDGYLAEVHFIDGTALTPASFGETNSATNQWVPIEVTGMTYGTNGFYLPFSSTELANSFTDSSSSSHTITANGDVTNTRAQKKIGSSSIKFDGSSDYLDVGNSSDWDFGSGDFTLECWARASALPDQPRLFGDSGGNWFFRIGDVGSDKVISAYNGNWFGNNSQGTVSVDTWYHFAWSRESGTNRFFFNGNLITAATITDASISTTNLYIGGGVSSQDLDGYMDEIRISNTARYTSSFTPSTTAFTADSNTKLLIHSDFNGGLGADSSGNTNDFTPVNLVATDVMTGESPTNNFCTWNPLLGGTTDVATLSEGNLKAVASGSDWNVAVGTMAIPSTGKWYFENVLTEKDNGYIGIVDQGEDLTVTNPTGGVVVYCGDGRKRIDGTFSSYTSAFSDNDICGVAVDMDASPRTIQFYKNNSALGVITITGSCATDTVFPYVTSLRTNYLNTGSDSSFAGNKTAQGNQDDNGIGDFYYTPPSGYLALCSDNLPDPSIADPTAHFNTVLYTGNGSTQSITGVGFSPSLNWTKERSSTSGHRLTDIVRGNTKILESDNTGAENTDSNSITSFDSDGFSVGTNTHHNQSSQTYVSWNFLAGGTASSNTDGSITSSVSANTDAGFSIVGYTGNSTAGATVGHGLSQAPELVIAKERTNADSWIVFSEPLGNTKALFLNETSAAGTHTTYWNDTSPSSTVVTLGSDNKANGSGTIIMYCFHSVDGYSKVGSYTGNGSTDGTFVYTGFRPAYVMWKRTDSADNWTIEDSARNTYNGVNWTLEADTNSAEWNDANFRYDFLSNGFKHRNSFVQNNASGGTYIYLAFAESPFKYSNAR